MVDLTITPRRHTIRTRFALATGGVLLCLLLAVYGGGRYLLVRTVRQAERQAAGVGEEFKRSLASELLELQRVAIELSGRLARDTSGLDETLRRELLDATGVGRLVDMVALLTPDGGLERGCHAFDGRATRPLDGHALRHYLSTASPLRLDLQARGRAAGIIVCEGRPLLCALVSLESTGNQHAGTVAVGALLGDSLVARHNLGRAAGLWVNLRLQEPRQGWIKPEPDIKELPPAKALAQVVDKLWHIGWLNFETHIPVFDISGRQVAQLAVGIPEAFISNMRVALAAFVVLVACAGMIFIIPIFWYQSRLVLDPLSAVTARIQELGAEGLENGGKRMTAWPRPDEFGVLAGSVNGMLEEIDKRRRQLEQDRVNINAILAGIPDSLYVFNRQARVVEAKKPPESGSGPSALKPGESLASMGITEHGHDKFRDALAEVFRTGHVNALELEYHGTDSEACRYLDACISRIDEEQALVLLRDITKERQEGDEREYVKTHLARMQRMESLGAMAANIAHDFNNILTIIRNTVEVTWEPRDGEAQDEAVEAIRSATSRGAALTRELMTYVGDAKTLRKRENPNEMLAEMENLLNGVVAENVEIELKRGQNLPEVETDPHQFWKVFVNLIKNASEAFAGREGRITIATESFTMTRQNMRNFYAKHALPLEAGVLFQISDDGPGMPEEIAERAFEPFVSTKAAGRGLGLASAFGIVDAHGGGVSLLSERGGGTSIGIWLPAAPARDAPAAPDSADSAESGHALRRHGDGKILLIEDDPSIQLVTRIMLRSMGAEVIAAFTQREAQIRLGSQASQFSLVLLDASVGVADNAHLLKYIRQRAHSIPIIVMSGHSQEKVCAMLDKAYFDAYLAKPYTREELYTLLARFGCVT